MGAGRLDLPRGSGCLGPECWGRGGGRMARIL